MVESFFMNVLNQALFVLSFTAIRVSEASTIAPEIRKAKAAITSVFVVLDRVSKIDYSIDSGITKENLSGKIEFSHVNFSYPTRPGVQIFQDLCLTIESGKKKKGTFQHSSFLAGGAMTAAGRLVAKDGVLEAIWPYSGHNLPTEENFKDFISFLQENDVDLTNVKRCLLLPKNNWRTFW